MEYDPPLNWVPQRAGGARLSPEKLDSILAGGRHQSAPLPRKRDFHHSPYQKHRRCDEPGAQQPLQSPLAAALVGTAVQGVIERLVPGGCIVTLQIGDQVLRGVNIHSDTAAVLLRLCKASPVCVNPFGSVCQCFAWIGNLCNALHVDWACQRP